MVTRDEGGAGERAASGGVHALMRGVSVCVIRQIMEHPSDIDPCQKYRREKTAA